jgi:hypothetical protein
VASSAVFMPLLHFFVSFTAIVSCEKAFGLIITNDKNAKKIILFMMFKFKISAKIKKNHILQK